MRPGCHRHANVLEARVDLRDRGRLAQIHGGLILGTAELVLEHLHAVDRENQLVAVLEPLDVTRTRKAADRELVIAVRREVMLHEHSAARSKRHAFDMKALVHVRLRVVDAAVHARRRIADGSRRDDARGGDVLIEKRRRYLEHVGDVVETVALVVLRQQRGGVDLEREEIFDRVRILGAIQSVQSDAPGIRLRGVRLVERALEPADRGPARLLVRLRMTGRRHHVAAQLAHRGLENLALVRDGFGCQRIERDVRRVVVSIVALRAVLADHRPALFRIDPRRAREPDVAAARPRRRRDSGGCDHGTRHA